MDIDERHAGSHLSFKDICKKSVLIYKTLAILKYIKPPCVESYFGY